MSATPDSSLMRYVRRPQLITKDTPPLFEVNRRIIACPTAFEIGRLRVLEHARKMLNEWAGLLDGLPDPGAMLVFLPGPSVCHKFCQKIRSSFDHIPLHGERAIFPLFTDIRPDDTSAKFYRRVTRELTLLKIERQGDINKFELPPLFFIPIFLTRHAEASALDVITENVPATITDIVIRIFITTGDLPTLAIPDLKVVIDTGLHEVQYYDCNRGLNYVREEPISAVQCEQRAKHVGQTDRGLVIFFDAANCVRPEDDLPPVKRLDLSQSCLALCRLGFTFADFRNLPNEPSPELMADCQARLGRYDIVNERLLLTAFGRNVIKFAFFPPLFAASVVKFVESHGNDVNAGLFACLIFYVIENATDLIVIPNSTLFVESFCADSDVVTLYSSILTILTEFRAKDGIKFISKRGFNASSVLQLRQILLDTSRLLSGLDKDEITGIVHGMRSWVDRQNDKSLGLIDKLFYIVRQFDEKWFAVRTAKFNHVIGAASCPVIVYTVPGLPEDKLVIESRPGWQGLVAPGSCYVLSIQMNQTTGVNNGFLIHRILHDNTPGVVSREVEPVLFSPFSIALFESYLGEHAEHFVRIEMSHKPLKKPGVLIHLTPSPWLTHLNYCPRTQDTETIISNAIPVVRTLLPFVPRSIFN
jgi:hypothetical protein